MDAVNNGVQISSHQVRQIQKNSEGLNTIGGIMKQSYKNAR